MRKQINIEELIEQVNNIDLSIKNLKKDIKNIKHNKTKKNTDIKRPLNSYMLYYTENYKNIKDKNPDLKSKDIAKLCGENWKNMKTTEKTKYENKAKKNKEKYEKNKVKEIM